MALISTTTIISSVSLFHIALAYYFIANPAVLYDQNLVYIVGESMGLPEARGFDTRSSPLGLVAILIAFLAVSDLVSLTMPEEITLLYYWGIQAPIRFLFSMVAALYTYLSGPASPFHVSIAAPAATRRSIAAAHSQRQGVHTFKDGWGGDALVNRFTFTFLFLEMIFWFWIWITLREEQPAIIEKARRDMPHQHDD
ncbi:hypothetical protein HJFPF1_06043 [Paramyrothecium foliicola]|nr:hypothetical protein HJFPF1_06043 [Paramyrothecium foliicola]